MKSGLAPDTGRDPAVGLGGDKSTPRLFVVFAFTLVPFNSRRSPARHFAVDSEQRDVLVTQPRTSAPSNSVLFACVCRGELFEVLHVV